MFRSIFHVTVVLVLPLQNIGELVASVVLPHGDFACDPTLLPYGTAERIAAEEVSYAARKAGRWLSETIKPDIILLSTPHGIELTNDFAFYLGSLASGYATMGQDLQNSTNRRVVDLGTHRLAPNETQDLLHHLKFQAVSGILNFADSEEMPLRWGEVIPLLFVDSGGHVGRRHIILSHPLRRYTESSSMIPELLLLGKSIQEWADSRQERIALLISSDLSHTHRADGPYGYSNSSKLFDEAIGRWAMNPQSNADSLLVEATALQDTAKSCGFTGLVMLHGSLIGSSIKSQVMANRNATYYGMLVATFIRFRNTQLMADSGRISLSSLN